jgi:hypothetical protein
MTFRGDSAPSTQAEFNNQEMQLALYSPSPWDNAWRNAFKHANDIHTHASEAPNWQLILALVAVIALLFILRKFVLGRMLKARAEPP